MNNISGDLCTSTEQNYVNHSLDSKSDPKMTQFTKTTFGFNVAEPVQRCCFTVPKCITKTMKAIGKFFRALFNQSRSGKAKYMVSRPRYAVLSVRAHRFITLQKSPQAENALIDGLKDQGVNEETARTMASKGFDWFRTPDGQRYKKFVISGDSLFFERTK